MWLLRWKLGRGLDFGAGKGKKLLLVFISSFFFFFNCLFFSLYSCSVSEGQSLSSAKHKGDEVLVLSQL